jgi:hypothetical protein
MNKKSKLTFAEIKHLMTFGIILCSANVSAQQTKIENIGAFRTVEEIDQEGFCAVYEEDGQKGKIRNYTLKFLDFGYSATNAALVELSKVASVSSSISNTTHLAIAFSDSKLKQSTIKSFDKKGNLTGTLNLDENAIPNAKIYKAPVGFVIVNPISKSALSMKAEFEIIGVDNELNVLWKKKLNDETVREVEDVFASEDGTAVVYTSGKGMGKENYDQHLLKIASDGTVVFDEVFANNYFYFPNKILTDGENTLIFGSFPEKGKSKPAGVFGIAFNAKGEVVSKKEVDYSTEISPEIKDIMSEEDINMKESPQFIVNDVIKTADGYTVITETIQLRPAIGLAVQVSTGGSGGSIQTNTAFFMGDFLILNLKTDLSLNDIKVVTKAKNRVVFEGIIANVNLYHQILKENDVSNFQFWMDLDGNPTMVYTIRENFRSNIKVGVADLTNKNKVLESKLVESELAKMKDIDGFGVLKNIDNKLCVYVYKRGVLSFYNLEFE